MCPLSLIGCRRSERGHGHRAGVFGCDADQAQEAGDPTEGAGVCQETQHAGTARAARLRRGHPGSEQDSAAGESRVFVML